MINVLKVTQYIRLIIAIILLIIVLIPLSLIRNGQDNRQRYDKVGLGISVNKWLDSHPNLRKQITRVLKFGISKLSPSESLSIGKEGWIFYALDYNLDIPKGNYPLTDEILDYQIIALTNINEYYKLINSHFYYLLYPSKTSIYSEYMRGDFIPVKETPVDILTRNFNDNTNLNIISPKNQILSDKKLGLMYLKMDPHTSDLGAYSVYKTICSNLGEHSGLDIEPVPVNFVDGEYHIGINDIAGVPNLFGVSETGPVAQYEPKARRVTEGEFYNKVAAITTSEANSFGNSAWVIFENPDANNGTLLIYGTSMWLYDNIGEQWQLTRYLAENFKRVVYTGINTMIMPDLDSVVNPDIVIVELPERYARRGGYRDAIRVPIVADFAEIEDIPQLEESLPFKDNGIRLDSFGTQILKSDDMCELGNQDSVVLSGWAEDINSGLPLSALYLRVGDTLFQCNYGTIMRRDQLADAGYSPQYTKDTFSVEIPSKLFKNVTQISFIAISQSGDYKYEPATYYIKQ
jgi:hypothetical protein